MTNDFPKEVVKLLMALALAASAVLFVFNYGEKYGRTLEQADIAQHCEQENIFLDRGIIIQCKVMRSNITKPEKMT